MLYFHSSLSIIETSVSFINLNLESPYAMGILVGKLRIHVIELAPFGYQYYRGVYNSFDNVPPRYTWRKVDYRLDETMVYVDMQNAASISGDRLIS